MENSKSSNTTLNQCHSNNINQSYQVNQIFNNFQNISGTPATDPQGETPMFQAKEMKVEQQQNVDLTGWADLKASSAQ